MVNTPLITAQSPRVFTESYVTVWLTTESQCVGIKCSDFYREVIYLVFLGGTAPVQLVRYSQLSFGFLKLGTYFPLLDVIE